ncbi:MAG TPA: hypothetical protein VNT53_09500 [Pseudolysinimonas sp.]|nr:hypothetical protein [Pseudolysinimonas sp.]
MPRLVVVAIAALLTLGGIVLPATAASAADVPVEYSFDGVSWTTTPPNSFFSGSPLVVPGDSATGTIYMRSTRTTLSTMRIVITKPTVSDPVYGAALTLRGRDQGGTGMPVTAVNDIAMCTQLVPTRNVVAGDIVRVTIDAALATTLSSAQGQGGSASFRVLVGLSDLGVPTDANGCPLDFDSIPPDGGGTGPGGASIGGGATGGGGSASRTTRYGSPNGLAFTGSALFYPAIVVAGGALGVGWFLVIVARRRRRQDTEPTA